MKKRIITLLAVLALLVTCAVFAVQADGTTGDGTETVVDYKTTFKCPCPTCNGSVYTGTWSELPASGSLSTGKHYYLSGTKTTTTAISASGTNVILMDGATWNFNVARGLNCTASGAKLYLIGNDGATINVNAGTATSVGALAQLGGGTNPVEYHIYGDITFNNTTTNTVDEVTTVGYKGQGGFFRVYAGTLNIHGATDLGLKDNNSVPTFNAPNLVNATSSSRYGGVAVVNGSAGRIVVGGGNFTGSQSGYRGGIFYASAGQITINGGNFTGGKLSNQGGVVYINGSSTKLFVNGGTFTADASFSGTQGAVIAIEGGAVADMTAGTITNGSSKSGVRVLNSTFRMRGGLIKAGNVSQRAISVCGYNEGEAYLLLAGNASVGTVADGKLNASGAPNVSMIDYSDNANKAKGTARLRIDNDWTGFANIEVDAIASVGLGATWKDATGNRATCGKWDNEAGTYEIGGGHKGYLIPGDFTYDQALFGYQGYFVTCRVLLIGTKADSSTFERWYITAETAWNAIDDWNLTNAYVRLASKYDVAVPNNMDAVVDLNGISISTLTIGTNSTLSVWDQDCKKAGDAASSATVVEKTGVNPYYVRPNGDLYVMNGTKCYKVAAKINAVSLRQNETEAGMYYTAGVTAHADAGITAWGVAVTLNENETALAEHLYTRETDTTKLGNEFNSVLVKGIAKSAEHTDRAAAPIYAKAYIVLADGTVYMSDAADYSLNDLMQAIINKGTFQTEVAQMATYGWFNALAVEMTA